MTMNDQSTILHADMDAFFAAVAQRDRPELRGKPIAIGGRSPRSVVAAASYEARPYGVRSAMPMVQALRLCPKLMIVSHDWDAIQSSSKKFFEILRRFTPTVEPLSVDEAFLDVASVRRLHGTPEKIAIAIRKQVRAELGLVVSIGVAPSKYIAKIASDIDKPNGLRIIDPNEILGFLHPLPVSRLWGVGKKGQEKLHSIGLQTIGDVYRFLSPGNRANRALARKLLGNSMTSHIEALANGRDGRRVEPRESAKSIGHEQTFDVDIGEKSALRPTLLSQSEKVGSRLRSQNILANVVILKIKFANFKQVTRRITLASPTDDDMQIARSIFSLLEEVEIKKGRDKAKLVRLCGVAVSGLQDESAPRQLLLQSQDEPTKVSKALDTIREKFGADAISRAGTKT